MVARRATYSAAARRLPVCASERRHPMDGIPGDRKTSCVLFRTPSYATPTCLEKKLARKGTR